MKYSFETSKPTAGNISDDALLKFARKETHFMRLLLKVCPNLGETAPNWTLHPSAQAPLSMNGITATRQLHISNSEKARAVVGSEGYRSTGNYFPGGVLIIVDNKTVALQSGNSKTTEHAIMRN